MPNSESIVRAASSRLPAQPGDSANRLAVLDGWRGISIASVLACHLLPLGPKNLQLNEMAGPFGMALFFTLSGFLITSNLLRHPDWRTFFIRRGCRILPLALLYITVALLILGKGLDIFLWHAAFLINYQFSAMTDLTGHFWSLCVEIHFYLLTGLTVLLMGRKGIWIFPILGLGVTALRMFTQTRLSLETHLRADEILAGASMALMHERMMLPCLRSLIAKVPVALWIPLTLVACHPSSGFMGYARPYLAMFCIACTLWHATPFTKILSSRPLKYLAETSYALYVIHPMSVYGWLGAESGWKLYVWRRPLSFAITFIAAHLSTFQFEKRWINLGKKWTAAIESSRPARPPLPATSPAHATP